jgi:hypothetical protein
MQKLSISFQTFLNVRSKNPENLGEVYSVKSEKKCYLCRES